MRALPPSQRAQKQQEINQQRQLRAAQRIAARGPRRNGQARVTPQAARQGRFAAGFAAPPRRGKHQCTARVRSGRLSSRQPGGTACVPPSCRGIGPVFWPYAYSDIFDYAFWPNGYDDGYLAYAYDDFFDGVFWGEVGPPDEYAYARAPPAAAPTPPSYAAVQELCKQPGTGDHRLAVRGDRAEGRPQCRAEAIARRRAQRRPRRPPSCSRPRARRKTPSR